MINVNWLLEEDVFEENLDPLKDTIVSQGMTFTEAKYAPFESGKYDYLFSPEDCVVFYGSLNLGRQLYRQTNFHVFCTLPNYECTKYYAYFGAYLLNEDYIMLPFSELYRRRERMFFMMGEDNCIFVRPSSGAKIFTGQLMHWEDFDKEYNLLSNYDVSPEATVVVSRPFNIVKEWRLIIVDMKVVAGSLYNDRTTNTDYSGYPDIVGELAQKVLDIGYEPDRAWTMDVCQTKDGLTRLLEIGGFSCAGLYEANKELIVREVSRVARELTDDGNR